MSVRHYDVKNAFLNGELKETVYMRQPKGYEDNTDKVCKLQKGLYGLKQAAKGWNEALDSVLRKADFKQSKTDSCLYTNMSECKLTYLIVYVDDLLVAGNDLKFISYVEKVLKKAFHITDLGEVHYCLGVQIERDAKGIFYLVSLRISKNCYTSLIYKIVRRQKYR